MYKFVIRKAILKAFIKHVSALTDEATLMVTREGWKMTVVDPGHITMCVISMAKADFEGFPKLYKKDFIDVGLDGGTTERDYLPFDLDIEHIQKHVLKHVPRNVENISLELTTEAGGSHIIQYGNMTFHEPHVDRNLPTPKVPNLKLPVSLLYPVEPLMRAMKCGKGYDDFLDFDEVDGEMCAIIQSEEHKRDISLALDHTKAEERFHVRFSADALATILSTFKGEITLKLGVDYPTEISQDQPLKCKYLLAPRIDCD